MIYDKTFYLIAGPNGSGKSTLANELLLEDKHLKSLNADDIAREKNVSVIQSGRELIKSLNSVFENRQSFVLETTLSGTLHNNIITRAKNNGYSVVFIYVFLSSVEQNLARIRQRVALGGHDVPNDIVRRRYTKSILNFQSVCSQADNWMLYYNGDKFFNIIARGGFDRCEIIDREKYKGFMQIRDKALEDNVSRLAHRGACRAHQDAALAGVKIERMKFVPNLAKQK